MKKQSMDPQILKDIYRRASLIRQNDDASMKALKAGRVVMPYYSPRGQEIIPATISACLTDEDYICTIYRGTHDMLAKGMPLKLLWAEIAGRATGACKGKGGPMHLTYPAKGIMVTTGVVGSSMPIANGLAWASQLAADTRVTIAYFGDGASNIGAFHESLNMAAIWKLPVVFVCQNNLYGEHSRYDRTTSAKKIADRAIAYDMPGIHVDGNDPAQLYPVAKEAIERARRGEGPTLIEAMTFRFNGHLYGDADAYMDKEQKAAAMAADPVPRFRQKLVADGICTDDELNQIDTDWAGQIEEAIQFAMASPFPNNDELRHDVLESEVLV